VGKKKNAFGINEGFTNYLAVLREVDRIPRNRSKLKAWLVDAYKLSDSYAKNVVTMLLFGSGLLESDKHICELTDHGRHILESSSPIELYLLFSQQFIGFGEAIEILNDEQPLIFDCMFDAWHSKMKQLHQVNWKTSHAKMQFRHRLEFLRSVGLMRKLADGYYLSKIGMDLIQDVKRGNAQSAKEKEKISHNEIENKLRMIGDFFEFTSLKRASVNDARPSRLPALKEDRQLDCLWARAVSFGGEIQYAFEVQVGGSISDAIERLEMVSSFVQKAIVVTDDTQAEKIRDRLEIKHSPLRDKITFLSYADINNVAEAVSALTIFTRHVFHD